VVIDGSTDATLEVLKQSSFNLNSLKIIAQENGGRSKVRNRGVRESVSDLIIFMDDDIRFTPKVIEQHVFHHQKRSNSILTGSQIEDLSVIKNDIQHYKRHLSLSWLKKYNQGLNKLGKQNLFLSAANMSIPKKLFMKLGGFDECLTDTEDKKLGIKALDLSFDIYFNKDIIGWHDDLINCQSYILRRREYEFAHSSANLEAPISKLKKLSYFPFAQKLWVKLIDADFFINILPKKIRYKFYTLVIWGLSRYYPGKSVK